MIEGTLASVISNVGYEANTWIRPTNLYYITLETDGNQFFNPLLQKIYFDTSKELVKIKFSKLIPVSARVGNFMYNSQNKTLYFDNTFGTIYTNKSIEEPASGDSFYCYDPVEDEYYLSVIDTVHKTFNSTTLVLADSEVINKIQAATNGMRFFIAKKEIDDEDITFLDDPTKFYIEHNMTEYDADIYISTDHIDGFNFEINKAWGL